MARNGGGVYSLPAIYEATTGETATAEQHNTPLEDLEQDANTARPIVAGGTGGTTEQAALTNLFDNSAYVRDSKFILADADDTARKLRLDLANITTGNTRVITAPDRNMDLAKVPDASLAQSFTTDEKAQLLENIGAAWELIGTASPSGASSADFTGLGDFRVLRAVGVMAPSSDNVTFFARTSTDDGANFDSTAGNYPGTDVALTPTNAVAVVSSASTTAALITRSGVGNGSGEMVHFDVLFSNFNQSAPCEILANAYYLDSSAAPFRSLYAGRRFESVARNALRFAFASGNGTGFIYLMGLRS